METQTKAKTDLDVVAFVVVMTTILLGMVAVFISLMMPGSGNDCLNPMMKLNNQVCHDAGSPAAAQATIDAWHVQSTAAASAIQTAEPVVVYADSEITVKRVEDHQTKSFIYFCTRYGNPVQCDTKDMPR